MADLTEEFEKLRREVRRLRKRVNELEERVAELEDDEADRQMFDHLHEFDAWKASPEGLETARQLTRQGIIGSAHGAALMEAFRLREPEVTEEMREAVERLVAFEPPPPPPDGEYPPLRPVK